MPTASSFPASNTQPAGPDPSKPKAPASDPTTMPIRPTGAYQMEMLPGAESPLIQPKPNPLTMLNAASSARLRPAVSAQNATFRSQPAFLPAQRSPTNGRKTMVMGFTAMDRV